MPFPGTTGKNSLLRAKTPSQRPRGDNMSLYELGVIIDPEVPPEDESSTLERLEGIITDAKGEVLEKDTWGRRQLAYPIKKKNYGVYHFSVVQNFRFAKS